MVELYDERRQEPRFNATGSATLTVGEQHFSADILDLSLNGMKLSRPDQFPLGRNERCQITLHMPEAVPFSAEILLVFAGKDALGIEFFDMPPTDFTVLARLVTDFVRRATPINPV